MMGGWGPYGYGMGWGGLGMLLELAVLVLLVYLLVRAFSRSSGSESRDRALETLRERYAKGEIDKETFERMLRDLKS